MKHSPINATLVDRLGNIKAQMAPLMREEKELKAALIATNEDRIDGMLFRSSISRSDVTGLNTDRVKDFIDQLVDQGVISGQKRTALYKKSTRTVVKVTSL